MDFYGERGVGILRGFLHASKVEVERLAEMLVPTKRVLDGPPSLITRRTVEAEHIDIASH